MERAFGTISSAVGNLREYKVVQQALIFAAWKETAGPQIVKNAFALDYRNGRLIVAVIDATWKQNLEALAPSLLAKLNASLDGTTVSFLEFREGPARFAENGSVPR